MVDPIDIAGSNINENEPHQINIQQNRDDLDSSLLAVDRQASRGDGRTAVHYLSRIRPPHIPHRSSNVTRNNMVNNRAGTNPRKILPRRHPLPTRIIPSHFQSNIRGMTTFGNNVISKINQIRGNISAEAMTNNHSAGISGANIRSSAIRFDHLHGPQVGRSPFHNGGNTGERNQSLHNFMARPIQSNNHSSPHVNFRFPTQEQGGNAPVMVPTNIHDIDINGNIEMLVASEMNGFHHPQNQNHHARRMTLFKDGDGSLQLGGNKDNVDPCESHQEKGSENFDDFFGPDTDLVMPGDLCYSSASSVTQFPLSETEQIRQNDLINYLLNELPPIQRHQGYLHNVIGPDNGLSQFTAPNASNNIQAASVNNDELPSIQQHQGYLSNIRGPDDPIFLPTSCNKHGTFASPLSSAGSSEGVIEFGRIPNLLELMLTGSSGSTQSQDQSGKPNLFDESGIAQRTRKRKPCQLADERSPQTPCKAHSGSAEQVHSAQSDQQLLQLSQVTHEAQSDHDMKPPYIMAKGNCKFCCQDLNSTLASLEDGPHDPVTMLVCGHVFHNRCMYSRTPTEHSSNPPCQTCANAYFQLGHGP